MDAVSKRLTGNNSPSASPGVSWPRSAQWSVAFLLGLGAAVLLGRAFHLGAARPSERERIIVVAPVDLNGARKSELMQLPGVGERTADKILASRDGRGRFSQVDDLRAVKGIGPARLEAIRPWLRVGGDADTSDPSADAKKSAVGPRTAGGKKDALPIDAVIDMNRAAAAELQKLPGIGPVLAQRIIAERDKAPFRTVEDLRRVSGIGPKTLDKLRPHVSVGSSSRVDEVAATPP